MSRHLVIGGARSGKSRFAQAMAEAHAGDIELIVTAEIWDAEMAERIAKHRAERPAHWHVTEAPLALPEAISNLCQSGSFVLVDCLTLWLSNILCTQPDRLPDQLERLYTAIEAAQGTLVMVSNEVGWSIVPENKLARLFRDEQGRLNQGIATRCEQVTLVAAGLPLQLKGA
ncbi:bifunctional adenosylcobinamide kinase/adenosylcobinamide-phosphate guanylyltransferase [Uliginosibacterium gangwonense]|uniref:bifunctional adenosylcobinamide kinase/adenosylcobinamide-phosphate guanylyltransferase n=1 Tax=Uliginosibacterium gangwonense TaxID=392736 RepID=UPI00037918C4|nr:bifunctional adenosylcobinamide kinase/adenosylcobinamide-phosphate guanylyltransferase [Uliginosibacterium gangwonense]